MKKAMRVADKEKKKIKKFPQLNGRCTNKMRLHFALLKVAGKKKTREITWQEHDTNKTRKAGQSPGATALHLKGFVLLWFVYVFFERQ